MEAAILTEYNKIEWKNVSKPICNADEVLVKVHYGCICGSDQHIFKGEFHPRTQLPLIIGHEFGGRVEEIGKNVTDFKVGDKVAPDPIIWCGECSACKRGHFPACKSLKLVGIDQDGGFCQYISLPPSMLYKVHPSIPDEHVALVEVLAIGCHAKNRAGVNPNDTIVIWGAGKIGLCILQAIRTVTDNTVFLIDLLDGRLRVAQKYYDNVIVINARNENPVERIKKETRGEGVNIAFEAVGHATEIGNVPPPLRGCIQSIQGGGTVCTLGLGDDPTPILPKELIWKEAKIVSSRVSHGEFAEVLDHLENNRLNPDMLITKKLHGSQAQRGFEVLENEPENHLKVLLDFG